MRRAGLAADPTPRRLGRRAAGLAGWIVAIGAAAGCAPDAPGRLVVATRWPESERLAVEAEFRDWASARDDLDPADRAIELQWIGLAPGVDLGRVISRRSGIDVALGGPPAEYARLNESQLIDASGWRIARTPVRQARPSSGDPRRDPMALAEADRLLEAEGWADGYAGLVRRAGLDGSTPAGPECVAAARPGSRSKFASIFMQFIDGSGSAQDRRPPGDARPVLAPPLPEGGLGGVRPSASNPRPAGPPPSPPSGRGGDQVDGRVSTRGRSSASNPRPASPPSGRGEGQADGRASSTGSSRATQSSGHHPPELLAELLGATLVDARAELIAARSALESAGWPARSSRWFAEAPPWPPASVAKLRAEAKGGPAPLVATLAEQVAPDPEVRAWLLRSWDRPPRPIDGALLDELAGALDGRVGREPRLRSWLRGEWTAWARQRYRRVARSIAAPPVARPGGNPS